MTLATVSHILDIAENIVLCVLVIDFAIRRWNWKK